MTSALYRPSLRALARTAVMTICSSLRCRMTPTLVLSADATTSANRCSKCSGRLFTCVSSLDASGAARRHQRQGLRNPRSPSCCARRGAGLLSLHLRLVAAGVPRRLSSFASSLGAGPMLCLGRCGLQPLLHIAAFTSCWSALFAFSAARAFGVSLLGLSLPGS